jgi:hypothetical protein
MPPIRELGWDLKPLDSARTAFLRRRSQVVLTIEHDVVHGVTPTMLAWWFAHLSGTVEVAGVTYPRYLVWHPRDHIAWQLASGNPDRVGVGARFRIVEAFERNPAWYVDSTESVDKLDETGIRLVRRVLGATVFRLEHTFSPTRDGTRYESEMVVGTDDLLGRTVLEPLVRPRVFPDDMARAWLRHNVEEVGNLERFLPALYADEVHRG